MREIVKDTIEVINLLMSAAETVIEPEEMTTILAAALALQLNRCKEPVVYMRGALLAVAKIVNTTQAGGVVDVEVAN